MLIRLLIASLLLTALSCRTLPEQETVLPVEYPEKPDEAEGAYRTIMAAVEAAGGTGPGNRDIDSRVWLMGSINTWADKDQLMVHMVYDALLYRNWDDDTRREFIELISGRSMPDDAEGGALNALRGEILAELDYLLEKSLLLKELPWMVRDFYDERSEFSYWYLLYIGRSFDGEWQRDTVLPAMRNLIREDRITAASYIWLNKPEALEGMKAEIRASGYPWNRILHLMAMGDYIRSEMQRLYPEGSPDQRPDGMLF